MKIILKLSLNALICSTVLFTEENIDETYGVNVQIEESDDDVSITDTVKQTLWVFDDN